MLSTVRKKKPAATRAAVSASPALYPESAIPSGYFAWKQWPERVLAILLLIPGIPIIALLAMITRLTSRGPGIFRQVRVGLHGRSFTMYKIRTMRDDAESTTGAIWAQHRDNRVTALGSVLRKLHLDEFPQLFNVLRGEMALMGPRPERPEFTQKLAREIPRYMERLAVLPGITGLAQINLPPDTDLNSVRRKLILDLEYVARATFFLDARMFLCTFARMIGLRGTFPMRLFAVTRFVRLPDDVLPEPPPMSAEMHSNPPVSRTRIVAAAPVDAFGSAMG
jgi:lipopolysaccharide/colanic/teichoic acid biosynthesis glycosyltransferase